MKQYTFTAEQLDDMKHALGFDGSRVTGRVHGKYETYRNHYTTSDNHAGWDALVEQGIANKRDFPHGCGPNPKLYSVSLEGMEYLSKLLDVKITEGR